MGGGYTFELPQQMVSFMAPQSYHYAGLKIEQPLLTETPLGSIAWQVDDERNRQPLFLAASSDPDVDSVVMVPHGTALHSLAHARFPGSVERVAWQPHQQRGVVSFSESVSGSSVHIFSFDRDTNRLATVPLRSHQGNVTALACMVRQW